MTVFKNFTKTEKKEEKRNGDQDRKKSDEERPR